MSMNKAERAQMAALEKSLAEARAFRRTDLVTPDTPPPEAGGYERYTFGFRAHAYGTIEFRADPCASTSVGHYRYYDGGKRSGGSQGSVALCSTRLLALQVARNKLEKAFAETLAELDAAIEAERANPTLHPEAA